MAAADGPACLLREKKKKIENKEIKILPLFCSSLISTVFS